MRTRLFATLALAGVLLVPAFAWADPAIVFVTRHAEKAADGKDPDLTPQGQARARNLAQLLSKAGIKNIFSTATARTLQTAQATAAQAGVAVQTYDPAKPASVIEKIKVSAGPTLLVGHSNTVPELVKLLGGAPGAPLGDDEFDRLYEMIIAADGKVTTIVLTTSAPP